MIASKKERATAQKSFIFDYLRSVKCHPTAEKVYEEVRKKLPTISQGTVYRVLNNFKDKGQVLAIDTKENVHFDADISDHAHFICEECGNVYDVYDECSKCGILKNRKTKVGKINKYQIKFYGTCTKCGSRKSLS
ncbi:MAG: transcriptional repressor [Candidatus Staskawiczbacteria bacterium]|nr:transcriptional repressor [Candidatus Staskawiczbacteria bacterium]